MTAIHPRPQGRGFLACNHVNEDAHIDRYYRELKADVKDFDPDEEIDKWVDAEDYIKDDWKEFADRYFRNHGEEPRADRVNVGSR